MVVQDLFYTKTAELADVVLPAPQAGCESEGTRDFQRAPRASASAPLFPCRLVCATILKSFDLPTSGMRLLTEDTNPYHEPGCRR